MVRTSSLERLSRSNDRQDALISRIRDILRILERVRKGAFGAFRNLSGRISEKRAQYEHNMKMQKDAEDAVQIEHCLDQEKEFN